MTADELKQRENELADKVMSLSVGKLLLKLHFFSAAVGRLEMRRFSGKMMTDGRGLYYGPSYILDRYKQSEALPVHDCLHMIMHNIFRHWNTGSVRPALWDAACDISVEAIIADISPELMPPDNSESMARILHEFSSEVRPLTAEKLYAYLDKNGITDEQAAEYSAFFSVDDHRSWHRPEVEPEKEPESMLPHFFPEFTQDGSPPEGKGNSPAEGKDGESSDKNCGADESAYSDSNSIQQWLDEQQKSERSELDSQWRELAKQILTELESFGRGEDTERLIDVLERVDREKVDYRAFLRRFMVSGEVLRADLDSFDVGFYCYGLGLYGNVALIEPPEYKEIDRVRDLVIALDTSGSVSGKIVHDFVQKTYTILKSENSFFDRVNIYILQCDTRIEDEALITCDEELERYIAGLEIKGLGGTDFRPVFDHVDSLRAERKLSALKGLIYFTDGIGVFPEKAPDYETAFVFLEGDYERSDRPAVPPWAIKLVLEEGDVLDGK